MNVKLIIGVVAFLAVACGDDTSSKKGTAAPQTSEAELRNRQKITSCQACHNNSECYCWWKSVEGVQVCVEVDREDTYYADQCAQYAHDELCERQPSNTTCSSR